MFILNLIKLYKNNHTLNFFIKKNLYVFLTPILLLVAISTSCTSSGTNPEDVLIVLPDSNLTFQNHIRPLFDLKCGSQGGCHGFDTPAKGLNLLEKNILVTYLVDGFGPLVFAGRGEDSFLYLILSPQNLSGWIAMPPDGPYLNENQKNGVKIWIDEGLN